MAQSYSNKVLWLWSFFTHYNDTKYWKMREHIVRHPSGLKSLWYLVRIKRMDAFNNASLGTHLGKCAEFRGKPYLPHGLNGIIVSNDSVIGKECILYHQVTIGGGNGGSPKIGDFVEIGAGAKVIGPITIGNHVHIGAGCVVAQDVPDNCTVVMQKPRIIQK
ncbi:MAG: serine acetyltransferase [Oscillospiraceae bacterium]|nr:serine acetyltransferase [Oscillospiraceae bacterium]